MRSISWMLLLIVATAIAGCGAGTKRSPAQKQQAPGLYSLTGWNYVRHDTDIKGEVGHRLYVKGPTANCRPGNWSGATRILSGQLPPGMRFVSGDNIEGVPTDRGHWIVKVELHNVRCEGGSYRGLTQELRFHITGSGRVVQ